MADFPPSPLPPSKNPIEAFFFTGNYDVSSVIVTICSALSLYNAVELLLLIFTTFKHYSGMYFWSLLLATLGIIPYTVGLIFEYFMVIVNWLARVFDSVGWVFMVTGQSVVLYSRLHLLFNNPRLLKAVKWMIIVDAVVYHITTTVLQYVGTYGNDSVRPAAQSGYAVFEKVQMTGFCVQEFIISGLYIWKTIQLLRVLQKKGVRRVMAELLLINIFIVIMDVALLVIEYLNWHVMEQTFKGLIYSVKLKLEFAILGKLVDLVKSSQRDLSGTLQDVDSYAVDESKSNATGLDVSRTPTTQTHRLQARPKDGGNSPNHSPAGQSSLFQSQPQWMQDLEKSVHKSGMVDRTRRHQPDEPELCHVEEDENEKNIGSEKGATESTSSSLSKGSPPSSSSHPLPIQETTTTAATTSGVGGVINPDDDADVMYAAMMREMTCS